MLLGLLTAGCAEQDPTGAEAKTALIIRARDQWRAAGLSNYSFTSSVFCFCPSEYVNAKRVTVRGGVVTAVVDARTREAGMLRWRQPVDSLFALALREAIERPSGLDVTFDAAIGYPRRLAYGSNPQIADAGAVITLDSVTADP
jgi:Family of unknown function (DUF6174)